jgi:predicted MFS family arabinose efflux permease
MPSDAASDRRLDRGLVALMAVATGLAVANNYYAQPLLPTIGRALHAGPGATGLIVTAAQVGYALGLVFLLPLGDLVERRRLIVVLAVATAAGLFWLGASPDVPWLLAGAAAVGAVSVVAQVLVPFAASLAPDEERGRVVGMVMSGLLIGILLARTVAGWLAQTGSWRVVYFAAGGAMLVQAAVLRRRLPTWREDTGSDYVGMLRSVLSLLRDQPILRLRSAYGLLSFGTFSVLWTSLAFLLSHHYHYGSGVIGLFGLAGAAGAVTATLAGRFSDRGWARYSTGITTALLLVSWGALWAGRSILVLLVVGIVVLDVGAQGVHITNQGEIYRLVPEARSRLTAAYMVLYFVGGAAGSVLSATLYSVAGWNGVCVAGAAFGGASFLLWMVMTLHPLAVFTPSCSSSDPAPV